MDPLKLLTRDETRQESFLTKYWLPGVCSAMGFATACLMNMGMRRPIMSGIQKHVLGTTSGWIIGQFIEQGVTDYASKREAMLRHYVELHPDDFVQSDRKKFKDVFDEWYPIR